MAQRIRVTTVFDCTGTGVTGHFRTGSPQHWHRQRNQQRNFETLTQIIGLYTQPQNVTSPRRQDHTWSFEFECEFEGVFRTGTDELGILKQTCAGTPMITGLDEAPNTGAVLTPDHNVWFEIV